MKKYIRRHISICLLALFAAPVHGDDGPPKTTATPALKNEAWTGRDYAAAAAVQSRKIPLPRLADAAGRNFLLRLTDDRNLASLQDEKVPLKSRHQSACTASLALSHLLALYNPLDKGKEEAKSEIAMLRTMILKFDALAPTLTPDAIPPRQGQAGYDQRMALLKDVDREISLTYLTMVSVLHQCPLPDDTAEEFVLAGLEGHTAQHVAKLSPGMRKTSASQLARIAASLKPAQQPRLKVIIAKLQTPQ